MKLNYRIVDFIFAILTVVALFWLAQKNLVPEDSVVYVQDFTKRSPFVSDLWPPESIGAIITLPDGSHAREFIKDNVTFFARPTRKFKNLHIEILADSGVHQKDFDLKTFLPDSNNRYNMNLVDFDIKAGPSAPGADVQRAHIKKITVEFYD